MVRRVTPKGVRRLADQVFEDLLASLQQFPHITASRGAEYLHERRVGTLLFSPGRISATVSGSRHYVSSWNLSHSGWRPSCTCPVAPECKHVYAVGATTIDLLESGDGIPFDDVAQVLMGLAAVGARTAAANVMGLPPPRAAIVAPPPEPPATFESLRATREPRARMRILERMLLELGIETSSAWQPSLSTVLEQRDPDVMGWMLAHEVARLSDGQLPASLEEFRDRPELALRAAQLRRPEIEEHLKRWAHGRTQRGERTLRMVLNLTPAPRGGCQLSYEVRVSSARINDEARSFQQLRTLQSQVRSNPALLTREHSDLLDALVTVGFSHYSGWNSSESPGERPALVQFFNSIMPSPDVRWIEFLPQGILARGGILPDSVVRFDPSPVRLLPSFDHSHADDEARLELVAVWADGRRRSWSQLLIVNGDTRPYAAGATFIVSEGVVYPVAEAPSEEILHLMSITPSVPVSRRDGTELVRTLTGALPAGNGSLAAITAVHDVEPVVLLHLDDEDRLQIRLAAHTPDGRWPANDTGPPAAHVFEFMPSGLWDEIAPQGASSQSRLADLTTSASVSASTSASASASASTIAAIGDGNGSNAVTLQTEPGELGDSNLAVLTEAHAGSAHAERAWLHAPDPVCVAPAVEWLRSIDARPVDSAFPSERHQERPADVGWSVKLTPRTIHMLADAWQRRPESVRWLGNRAMLALVGAGRSLTPRISAKKSGVDLLAVSAEWAAEGLAITDADLSRLRTSSMPWVKLSGGWTRRDALDIHDEVSDVLADLGVEPGAGEQQLSVWQLAQARPESLEALERMGADPQAIAAVRQLRERVAAFTGLRQCPMPKGFTGELRPYQRQGLDFLAYASSLRMGAILADDMGLGKTVQALAWLLHLRQSTRKPGPALVVCPASVVHNWEREARQFAPGLRVLTLASGAERQQGMQSIKKYDLVITNYALLRRDADQWNEIDLFAVIGDEAQQIKNPSAAVSQVACALRATHRLALTGTPLENRALDLWSIVQFVNPGYLGNQESFSRRFDRADAPAHTRRLLTAKLRPILLRRLKKDVAPELPDRIEERRDCEMTPGQRKLYLAELARARADLMAMAAEGGVKKHKIEILAALTRLRQICCHPQLAGGKASVGSGKFEALFDLLEPLLAEGHKVLLFSQFVKALELVRSEMKRRKIGHHMLTGSTTNRPGVVSAFEQDPDACVFLISLRAGGTGLNLTAASYVVLLDPWWNPAVEAQAIDRTHRIGQDRTVIAYRLLMQGTIEEKIWELQQRKAGLAHDILGGEDGFARALDREALDYLFAEE